MKRILHTTIFSAMLLSFTGCLDQLDQMPKIETTSGNVYVTAENYKAVLAKLYASFVTAGQEKDGNLDISSNSGYDFMRCLFNLQECGTDEVASTWLEGDKVYDLTYLSWDANDPWVSDMYYRAYYTVALCNEFLRYSVESRISRFTQSEQADIRMYALEARFLRSLAYYHVLDLFGQGPFVTEKDPVGAFIPQCYDAGQLFTFVEEELTEIAGDLCSKGESEYGRATQGAAYTLLAKLYLNSEVYTSTARYEDCVSACRNVLAQGYSLEPEYDKLFNADNHKRTNEIIMPFSVDATHTVTWGATTYIVCGAVSSTSDYQLPADYGVTSGWGMFRSRGEATAKFAEGDHRAMFFTEGQSQYLDVIDNQSNGYFVTKWTNLTDEGVAASNTGADGVNTDYPMFRLADVYLMIAESVARGATGSVSKTEAVGYVNMLRERAFGSADGNITESQLNAQFVLDERCRELYWECTRRTDLIRYGQFTTADYIWQWKGGVKDGRAVDSKYNIYPIPESDLSANPNLSNNNY